MFLAISANAQIVVNSRFKSMTFDEMAAPLIMAQRFQQECLNNLDALAEQTEQAEQFISEEKDPATWEVYADCYNSIIDEYNSILKNGTNQGTRRAISDLRRQSSSLLASIKAAYDRRNRLSNDQYARLRAVDGLMCNRFFSDISIDEFMNGKTTITKFFLIVNCFFSYICLIKLWCKEKRNYFLFLVVFCFFQRCNDFLLIIKNVLHFVM